MNAVFGLTTHVFAESVQQRLLQYVQVGRSSANFSTLSMRDTPALGPSNRSVAVYKGLKVAVYTVNKTEISLSRQDLVELVNVCSISFIYQFFIY